MFCCKVCVMTCVLMQYDEAHDKVVDVTPAKVLVGDALKDLGVLRCYLTPDDMKKLTAEALEVHLVDMQTCPFTVAQGQALYDVYEKHYPYVFFVSSSFMSIFISVQMQCFETECTCACLHVYVNLHL